MAAAPEKEKEGAEGGRESPKEQELHEAIVAREQKVERDLSHLKDYLQKVEEEPQAVTDKGKQILTPQAQLQTITLPLSEEEIKHGLHHKVIDSIRWLAAWCVRIAKKAALLGIRVIYPRQNKSQ